MVGISVVLMSIFVPYLLSARETSRRVTCADHLRQIGWALNIYAKYNDGMYPRVVYDPIRRPQGWAAYTGPYCDDPMAEDRGVQPSDVSASLWLLVRQGYISGEYKPASAVFACPSAGTSVDELVGEDGRKTAVEKRSNFRNGRLLGYSYCSPFSNAPTFRLNDSHVPHFVVMADKNPGRVAASMAATASPFDLAKANSKSHGGSGQNVLFADIHVDFMTTPYCGARGDNIFTALADHPVASGAIRPEANGVWGRRYGPAWAEDSFLVPSDEENDGGDFPPPPTTRPASLPTTATTTTAPSSQPATLPAGEAGK